MNYATVSSIKNLLLMSSPLNILVLNIILVVYSTPGYSLFVQIM